jgi:flagellar hook-basal body complex protein FliE
MTGTPLEAVAALAAPDTLSARNILPSAAQAHGGSFSQILMDGIAAVNERVANADAMVRAFTVDDSIPIHQVTFALEEARLSMELMMQVRARLVESYQRMMEMQL